MQPCHEASKNITKEISSLNNITVYSKIKLLTVEDISKSIDYLKSTVPKEVIGLENYFDQTYGGE